MFFIVLLTDKIVNELALSLSVNKKLRYTEAMFVNLNWTVDKLNQNYTNLPSIVGDFTWQPVVRFNWQNPQRRREKDEMTGIDVRFTLYLKQFNGC